MGLLWRGIPDHLRAWSLESLGSAATAIETGAFKGRSARILAKDFCYVHTIEQDASLARRAEEKLVKFKNVSVKLGPSEEILSECLPEESVPCLFWLDAHFSGGQTSGVENPCPVLNELSVILANRKVENTIILVDDLRGMFGANGWPRLDELIAPARNHNFKAVVSDDVLVLASEQAVTSLYKNQFTSRSAVLEPLGGRLELVIPLLRVIGWGMRMMYRIRHRRSENSCLQSE